jgi:environmental stress-induced protein Ves
VQGTLVAGAVRDFNLIVDRARASSRLEVLRVDAARTLPVDAGDVCVVHVISGELAGGERGETLVATRAFDLVPSAAAQVAVARIFARKASRSGG